MSVDKPIFGIIHIQMIKSRYSLLQRLPFKSKIKLIKCNFKQDCFYRADIILNEMKLNKITADKISKKIKQAYNKLYRLNIDSDKVIYGKTLKKLYYDIYDNNIDDNKIDANIINFSSFCGIPSYFMTDVFEKAYLIFNDNFRNTKISSNFSNISGKSNIKINQIFSIKRLVVKDTKLNFVNFGVIDFLSNRVQDICLYTEKIREAEKISEEILYETGAIIDLKHITAYENDTNCGKCRPCNIIDADTGKICFGDFVVDNIHLDIKSNSDDLNICNYADTRDIFELILKDDKLKSVYINDFYISDLICGKRRYKVNCIIKSPKQ